MPKIDKLRQILVDFYFFTLHSSLKYLVRNSSKEAIKTSSQKKKVKRGSAVTTQESLFTIARLCFALALIAAALSAIMALIFKEKSPTQSLPFIMVIVVLLINSTLTTTSTNKIIANKTVKKKILNKTKKGEFQPMFELAKQLIDKECKIYAVGFASGIKGVIKEVTDAGIRVETKYGDYLLNLDFVTAIECKNK